MIFLVFIVNYSVWVVWKAGIIIGKNRAWIGLKYVLEQRWAFNIKEIGPLDFSVPSRRRADIIQDLFPISAKYY